ncbi:MAG: rhodanese-like domain-containing protein [Lachnospiraceae bacterium]|nr:rhodanese-like domain-containing protein [Lachnospiraceae bacterium]
MTLKIISPGDLENYINNYNTILIDLRDKADYKQEHIPGAVWADWEELDKNIGNLLMSYNKKPDWIILYCERGNISLLASRDLARLGYPVISLNGGYVRWQEWSQKKNKYHARYGNTRKPYIE